MLNHHRHGKTKERKRMGRDSVDDAGALLPLFFLLLEMKYPAQVYSVVRSCGRNVTLRQQNCQSGDQPFNHCREL